MPFSNLTIVSVTGSDTYAKGSLCAIVRSCQELLGSKGLLISPTCPENFAQLTNKLNISYQPCKPFGYLEYSIFMIYSLADYIDTDYCLVVQNDGWVLNGKNWKDEFWNYDYIGSPTLLGLNVAYNEQGSPYFNVYDEVSFQIANNKEIIITTKDCTLPQNGGFSLRSKRLLELPRQLGVSLPITAPDRISTDQLYKFKWGDELPIHYEDLFLSVFLRPQLEQEGIKFAPLNVANQFGFYTMVLPTITHKPFSDYFGFHLFEKVEITDLNSVQMNLSEKYFIDDKPKDWVIKLAKTFLEYGYNDIQIKPINKK